MKKFLILLIFTLTAIFADSGYHVGEHGSEVYSFKVKLRLDLIKLDGTKVNLLDGSKYLETKCEGSEPCVADEIETASPPAGKYKGVFFIVTGFKYKAKVVSGGVAYYTSKETVKHKNSWNLSTDSDKLGTTTVVYKDSDIPEGEGNRVYFGKNLTVSPHSDSSLVFIAKFMKHHVEYETESDMDNVTRISESEEALAITPIEPKKTVSFDIVYNDFGEASKLLNKFTIFLDGNNEVLGAFMQRLENKALNGSFFISATKDSETKYEFKIQNGDDNRFGDIGDDHYTISVDLNCTSGTYGDLAVSATTAGAPSPIPPVAYTLKTHGSIECKDIPTL